MNKPLRRRPGRPGRPARPGRPGRPVKRAPYLGRPMAGPPPCPPGCNHAAVVAPPGVRPGRLFPQRKILSRQAAGTLPLYPSQD